MMMNQICARAFIKKANCRFFSSRNNTTLALFNLYASLMESENAPRNYVLETGATRYWELAKKCKYYCIGAAGPINLDRTETHSKIMDLIDFDNLMDNKLHIYIVKCPRILKTRLAQAFPYQLDRQDVHIIQLSYDHYANKMKGKLDCVIAANYICKKFNDLGEFGFYSGSFIKDIDEQIFIDVPKASDHKKLDQLHVKLTLRNGCMFIKSLDANDVGVIYVNQEYDRSSLKNLITRHTQR